MVLAGGLGRRMGRDKTALRLPGDADDFLARAVHLLEQVTDDVRVSCRDDMPERLARAGGRPVLPDLLPGAGALPAVFSVLRQVRRPCLIIPCDMPFLTAGALRALLERRAALRAGGNFPLVTAWRRAADGFTETLTAVYEPESLPWFEDAMARQDYGLFRVVPPERRAFLDYGPELAEQFRNVNTPADWANALRRRDAAAADTGKKPG